MTKVELDSPQNATFTVSNRNTSTKNLDLKRMLNRKNNSKNSIKVKSTQKKNHFGLNRAVLLDKSDYTGDFDLQKE